MAFKVPRFDRNIALVEENRTASYPYHVWWDRAASAIESAITGIQDALAAAGIALAAAENAQTAADAAQAAATSAQTAADAAQAVADGNTSLVSVVNSGVDVNPLSATDAGTDATIIIAAHNRLYPDGTSVPVDGWSVTGLNYSTQYWVYYLDPTRSGGAVTYQATTIEANAAQAGDKHLVGKITTPAATDPDTNGYYKKYPGLDGLEP